MYSAETAITSFELSEDFDKSSLLSTFEQFKFTFQFTTCITI